jgi:hypothetical protein
VTFEQAADPAYGNDRFRTPGPAGEGGLSLPDIRDEVLRLRDLSRRAPGTSVPHTTAKLPFDNN